MCDVLAEPYCILCPSHHPAWPFHTRWNKYSNEWIQVHMTTSRNKKLSCTWNHHELHFTPSKWARHLCLHPNYAHLHIYVESLTGFTSLLLHGLDRCQIVTASPRAKAPTPSQIAQNPSAIFDFTTPEDSPVGDVSPRFRDYDMKGPCP